MVKESNSEASPEKALSRLSTGITSIVAIVSTVLGLSAWINTRASKAEVEEKLEAVRSEAIRACSLNASKEDVARLEKRMDKTGEILVDVRDSVIKLMARQEKFIRRSEDNE